MARNVLALVLITAALGCDGDADPSPMPSTGGEATGDTSTGGTTGGIGTSTTAAGEESQGETGVDTTTSDDPPQTDACDPGANPTIEVGHGESTFEPFDAHPAELVYGVQGGYHIVIGVRGAHTDNTDVSVVRMTGFIDGEELAFSAPYVELRCVDERQEALNLLLIWDTTPDELHGKTALVRAELTDAAGDVFLAEGEVVIDDPTMK